MTGSKNQQRVQLNRKKFLEYKKTLKCQRCHLTDHRILEFHHLGDKDHNISNMVNHGYGWKRIEEEIVKCIPFMLQLPQA
jgi:hypothetical protein